MTSDWSSTTKDGLPAHAQAAGARSSRSSQPIDVQDDLGLREGLARSPPRRDRRSTWARPSDIVGCSTIWSWMNLVRPAERVRRSCTLRTLGMAAHDVEDALALLVRQLAVHQHVDRIAADRPGARARDRAPRRPPRAVDQRLVEPAGEPDARRRRRCSSRSRSCSARMSALMAIEPVRRTTWRWNSTRPSVSTTAKRADQQRRPSPRCT